MMSTSEPVLKMYDLEFGTKFADGGFERAILAGDEAEGAADVDKFMLWVKSSWDRMDKSKKSEFDVKLGDAERLVDLAQEALAQSVWAFEPDKIRSVLEELREFSERPENWTESNSLPHSHMRTLGEYGVGYAVWTVTADPENNLELQAMEGRRVRLVVVGRIDTKSLPAPPIVWTIAHMLGLRGAKTGDRDIVNKCAEGWKYNLSGSTKTVMIIEPLEVLEQH